MSEPRTEAGRALVGQLQRLPPAWGHVEAIAAIEAEAVAAALQDIRAAVEKLPNVGHPHNDVSRAAVLAIIEERAKP